ncbi:MAG: 6-pyruvoyl-tetrahydropterin synthase-related protein [Anaerolineales bacterium]
MNKFLNKFEPGLLIVFVATTLAAWPFLSRPSLPTDTDAEIHIFRAAQIERSITEGVYYPRWAPDFYYGNGYPIFNYYAPLAYHLAAYYSLATGLGVVAGSKFVLVIAAFIGSLGMYFFVANRWGRVEAMVAGVAWGLSPYIFFLEPHARGEIAETLAIGISPVIFWAFDKVRGTGTKYSVVIASLSLGAVVLSHPLTALVAYGFLLVFLLWEFLITPLTLVEAGGKSRASSNLYAVGVAVLLGLGLSALYWLPAGFERDAVRMDYYGIGHYDFRRHFIDLSELIAPAIWSDSGAAFPVFRFSLGSVQVMLGILGLATVFNSRLRRSDTLLMTLGVFAATYMMTSASQGLWEMIPPMRYFQFPMRFLGSAALAIVPLCGMSMRWILLIKSKWIGTLAPAVAIGLLVWSAMPLMYPPKWSEFGEVTSARFHSEELQGKWFGTTCCHDFLPVNVEYVPPPDKFITKQFQSGIEQIEKFERDSLPDGTTISLSKSRTESELLKVSSANPFDLKFARFYFPGWQASIDGVELPIEITKPDGRISVSLPAGKYDLLLEMTSTPIRSLANTISLAAAIVIVLILYTNWFKSSGDDRRSVEHISGASFAVTAIVLILGIGLKVVGGTSGWFQYHSTGRNVHVAENGMFASVADEIELIGYDTGDTLLEPGESLDIVLYWRADVIPSRNYQIYLHLRSENGELWGQSDKVNPASFPTSRWSTNKYVRDEHMIVVDKDAPAGEYQVHVGLWDHVTGERFLALDKNGWLLGESIPVAVDYTVQ